MYNKDLQMVLISACSKTTDTCSACLLQGVDAKGLFLNVVLIYWFVIRKMVEIKLGSNSLLNAQLFPYS